MVSIWRIGGYGMTDVWLRRIVWIGLPIMSFIIWYYVVKLIMCLINWGI